MRCDGVEVTCDNCGSSDNECYGAGVGDGVVEHHMLCNECGDDLESLESSWH